MNALMQLVKTYFVHNWKTTVLGAVAAIEIYQTTHNAVAAITAFVTGLVAKDANVTGGTSQAP